MSVRPPVRVQLLMKFDICVKVKVTFTLEQATMAQRSIRSVTYAIFISVFEDLLMLFHFLNCLTLSLNSCMTKGIHIIFRAAIYLGFYGILR